MVMDLRPLSLAELLDRAFTLYRRNLWLFVGIMAIPSAIGLVFSVLFEVVNRRSVATMDPAAVSPEQAIAVGVAMVGGMLLALVAYFIVYAVALGAITLAVSEIYQGRATSVGAVYGQMKPRMWRLTLLLLGIGIRIVLVLAGWMVLVGVFAGILGVMASPLLAGLVMVPGMLAGGAIVFFLMLRWGVAVPALVLEERTARESIRRSIELTRGRLGRVALLVICATIISYAAMMIFQGPFLVGAFMTGPDSTASFWLSIFGIVSGTVGATITGPIMIVGLALLYYDARIRDEGLDLQMMMAALETPAAPLARA